MKQPLISIITPTCNSASSITRYFLPIINSGVCDQLEIIIIDCQSADSTLEIINSFKEIADITVISEPDNGIYDAMNKGISFSRGDYLWFLNSDDWAEPKALNYLKVKLTDRKFDLLTFTQKRWVTASKFVRDTPSLRKVKFSTIPHQTIIFSREIIKKIGFYDTSYKMCADYDYLLKLQKISYTHFHNDIDICNFSQTGFSSNINNLDIYYHEILSIWKSHNIYRYDLHLYLFIKTKLYKIKKLGLSFLLNKRHQA